MKPQFLLPLAALAAFSLAGGPALAAPSLPTSEHSPRFSGHRLAHAAHVTLADARGIALKARPGDITDEELEKERGGSGLRYSFDVKSGGATYEVGVDAKTGQVLENGGEGKNPD
jgi:uncharacterized membrane protein YkoI